MASETALCLLGQRIQVSVRWRNQHADGEAGVGHAVPLTDKTGAFWFFDEDNYEIMIKALDGTSINGSVWIFFGSLSDVEYWIDVVDTESGRLRTYYNPPGNVYGIADTAAFRFGGVGQACGGPQFLVCDDDLICDPFPSACLILAPFPPPGICVERPTVCPLIFAPVCGCDGVTYSNDCERLAAAAPKLHDGPCDGGGIGEMCGGIAGIPCSSDLGLDLVCDLDPGSCNVADVAGTCVVRPEVCIEIYAPVCGCDGVTYPNDCHRLAAGVPKDHDGECASSGA